MLDTDTIQITPELLALIAEIDERHRGAYKTLSNSVAAFDAQGRPIGVVFETASPFDTPRRMAELVAWLNEARALGRLHPLLVVAALPELAVQIVNQARQHGRVTIGEMIRVTGTSRNTLKEHFRRLVEQGHLLQRGRGKGTWYTLP